MRAVIFDLDGTLFDHAGSASAALASWLPTFGVPAGLPTDAAVLRRWFELEDLHYPAARRGEISWAEQRRRRVADFLGELGITAADGDAEAYRRAYQHAWRRYPDAVPCLLRMRRAGLRIAILTNGDGPAQRAKLTVTGLEPFCEVIGVSTELGHAKPDPRSYRAVLDLLALPPAEVLMVGDNHQLDVLAARASGLSAVHLDRDGTAAVADPHRIRTLDALAVPWRP